MSDRRFGRSGSDAALEVTGQFQEVLHAEVLDVAASTDRRAG
jgi:hypothetical protein